MILRLLHDTPMWAKAFAASVALMLCLIGLGTNAYAQMSFDRHATYVHNIAAEALCEHGLIGASA